MGSPGLSLAEQRTQVTLWTIAMAPLLLSADLAGGLDNATLAILGAPEVLGVSQDTLGVQVRVTRLVGRPGLFEDVGSSCQLPRKTSSAPEVYCPRLSLE